jgi:hypothetical protein
MDASQRTWRGAMLAGLALSLWIVSGVQLPGQAQQAPAPTTPQYAPNGDLLMPVGFETWVFVGSNIGMAYRQGLPAMTAREATRADAPRFHNVYLNPEAYAHFRATRQFPEPTILVMENFAAADKEPQGILSAGQYNGERVGLEVAVKNSNPPDRQNTTVPWAYYVMTDPNDPSKVLPSSGAFGDAACARCHRQHASMDNVWVQFYPTLKKLLP